MIVYPSGYGSDFLTLDELLDRHQGDRMHPEFRGRLRAALVDAGGLVGIGSGWRSTEVQRFLFLDRHVQVDSGGCCAYDGRRWALKPGEAHAAPPGSSFHESQRFASGHVAFQAVDTVGRDGAHAAAWEWLRVNGARFGLLTFWNVNGEPWHVQCNDLPRSVSAWKAAGSPDPERKVTNMNGRRLIDSRHPSTDGIPAGDVRRFTLGNAGELVTVNVAAKGRTAAGWLAVYTGERPAGWSTVNYRAGEWVANEITRRLDDAGRLSFYASTACDVLVDLVTT